MNNNPNELEEAYENNVSNHQKLPMTKYGGNPVKFEEFVRYYYVCSKARGWSEKIMIVNLPIYLKGAAKYAYYKLNEAQLNTWTKFKNAFLKSLIIDYDAYEYDMTQLNELKIKLDNVIERNREFKLKTKVSKLKLNDESKIKNNMYLFDNKVTALNNGNLLNDVILNESDCKINGSKVNLINEDEFKINNSIKCNNKSVTDKVITSDDEGNNMITNDVINMKEQYLGKDNILRFKSLNKENDCLLLKRTCDYEVNIVVSELNFFDDFQSLHEIIEFKIVEVLPTMIIQENIFDKVEVCDNKFDIKCCSNKRKHDLLNPIDDFKTKQNIDIISDTKVFDYNFMKDNYQASKENSTIPIYNKVVTIFTKNYSNDRHEYDKCNSFKFLYLIVLIITCLMKSVYVQLIFFNCGNCIGPAGLLKSIFRH